MSKKKSSHKELLSKVRNDLLGGVINQSKMIMESKKSFNNYVGSTTISTIIPNYIYHGDKQQLQMLRVQKYIDTCKISIQQRWNVIKISNRLMIPNNNKIIARVLFFKEPALTPDASLNEFSAYPWNDRALIHTFICKKQTCHFRH
jgi:hypothetical protein